MAAKISHPVSRQNPTAPDYPISLKNWGEKPDSDETVAMTASAVVDCGWGRLIFGQTFDSPQSVAEALEGEREGERDVAFYVRDPHVLVALDPQALFLDPSHSFRLNLQSWTSQLDAVPEGLRIRQVAPRDEPSVNRLYQSRSMVPVKKSFCANLEAHPQLTMLVAEESGSEEAVAGVVMGVDHRLAFNDPDNGASLWALAVDPQAKIPGIGANLVVALAKRFKDAGRSFLDLSVMHDNKAAITLYEKLGFKQVPVFCVKRKNPINENLFVGPSPHEEMNIYAQIIIDEARRRGIAVEIEDAESGIFRLSFGGRIVSCRESLSDLTSAVALSRCNDKRLTRRLLREAGLNTPAQISVTDNEAARSFLDKHGRVVVKPAEGEMGRAVFVDLRTPEEVQAAIERANTQYDSLIMEEYVEGQDLRIIVIDDSVVAAAVRRPPEIKGDGIHTVEDLIQKQSRRRQAATGGESSIPLDEDTRRCVRSSGRKMEDVLGENETLVVRKTANLHVGGTIHDVTAELHPNLAEAAVSGAKALEIPVVGFDFIVPDPAKPEYVVIEANERPGLANHEPQPTAERFIDYLFSRTKSNPNGPGKSA